MKLKITESQYNSILKHINEGIPPPGPIQLTSFFNKNPKTNYFTIVKLLEKTKEKSEYLFLYGKTTDGFDAIKDVNSGTITKGCITQVNLDTMIYNNEFSVKFGFCDKTLNINNVVGIKLFDSQHNQLDEMEFDNTSTTDVDELVEKYNNELAALRNGDEVFFDTFKKKYDGSVVNKSSDRIEIEIYEQGKNNNILLYKNHDNHGFHNENGKILFRAIRKDVKNDTESGFSTPIKNFYTSNSGKSQEPEVNDPEEPEEIEPEDNEPEDDINPDDIEQLSDEELEAQAKFAYDEILKDKDLQKAFYRKPNFWNLFMAELKGEEAKGRGMVPTIQIVKGFKSNKIDDRLKGEFVEGEQVYYEPYHNQDILIYSNTNELLTTIEAGFESKAKVENLHLGDKTKQLVHRESIGKLIITIKSPTSVENVYKCDLKQETQKGKSKIYGTKQNVYLKFNPKSPGYKPVKKQTNP